MVQKGKKTFSMIKLELFILFLNVLQGIFIIYERDWRIHGLKNL